MVPHKIFIPNRGEIAVRIIRTANKMGIRTVVMLTEAECNTLPATLADEVYLIPSGSLQDTYLNIPLILRGAAFFGADAVHPGYGFLSENANLANACSHAGLIFVGPSARHLQLMGDKMESRRVAMAAGVPLIPALEGDADGIIQKADGADYPLLLKASMGGGGKGMTVVYTPDELKAQLPVIAAQSLRNFGDCRVYAEKYIAEPRHIEVQILADKYGNTVHLFERECSVQRRFQKIVEEAPSPSVNAEQRENITRDALKLVKSIGYENAGTVEFLVDERGNHYFLEMNTRIQVEHPVTEMITRIDIVEQQIRIAAGLPLSYKQEQILMCGHAIETRLCAEDPANGFAPSPGWVTAVSFSSLCRTECFFDKPTEILSGFDPLLAKVISHAPSRNLAIDLQIRALKQTTLTGILHNIPYLLEILQQPAFAGGHYSTRFCETHAYRGGTSGDELPDAVVAAALVYKLLPAPGGRAGYRRLIPEIKIIRNNKICIVGYSQNASVLKINSNGHLFTVCNSEKTDDCIRFLCGEEVCRMPYAVSDHLFQVAYEGLNYDLRFADWLPPCEPVRQDLSDDSRTHLYAPIPGHVVRVVVAEGESVRKGDTLLVIEAMKMENHLTAWRDAVVNRIHTAGGTHVRSNELLLELV